MTYLKAVKAVGTTDADKVMAQLKKTPINDFYAKGKIRADGRMMHDMYLFQVKRRQGIDARRGTTTRWSRRCPASRPSRRKAESQVRALRSNASVASRERSRPCGGRART